MRAMARSPDATTQTQAAGRRRAPDAKSRVMTAIGRMVDDGKAEWSLITSGDIELRLSTGEVFLLGEFDVTRVA
ncbi:MULTISPECIES: hypothetical protein [Mesorhizobium]|jgi:hypothetical protein|uniref:Uncharacterized protein n=1 Tax=Rhizobium loti TaxID=381 RepID=A0A8E3B7D8_RHILI|nr:MULTISPECIES: hypothetical protein [Mesorhizobium]PWJ94881.1 hypothetical protein C8D77_1011567 [Mesorhizobium loti]RUX95091.1 hypothetical protein EN993_13000 [Mesorhizobium sp. M7D.F.Ca.US.004.01.2.1]RVA33921.1 hypothetical protein EN935_08015 [Mesorhizobium sp. M7D.F.Ca.US.004.03.1.1]